MWMQFHEVLVLNQFINSNKQDQIVWTPQLLMLGKILFHMQMLIFQHTSMLILLLIVDMNYHLNELLFNEMLLKVFTYMELFSFRRYWLCLIMHIRPNSAHLLKSEEFIKSSKAVQLYHSSKTWFHNPDFKQIHLKQIMLSILSYHVWILTNL